MGFIVCELFHRDTQLNHKHWFTVLILAVLFLEAFHHCSTTKAFVFTLTGIQLCTTQASCFVGLRLKHVAKGIKFQLDGHFVRNSSDITDRVLALIHYDTKLTRVYHNSRLDLMLGQNIY